MVPGGPRVPLARRGEVRRCPKVRSRRLLDSAPAGESSSAGASLYRPQQRRPGAGLAGEKSGLWREQLRIVEEVRPEAVVVENVASGKRRFLPFVRRDLHLLGYDTAALAVSAADVRAPHERRRSSSSPGASRESGELEPSVMLPTPTASRYRTGQNGCPGTGGSSSHWKGSPDLPSAVPWATPTVSGIGTGGPARPGREAMACRLKWAGR